MPADPCTGARWRRLPTGHPSRPLAGARVPPGTRSARGDWLLPASRPDPSSLTELASDRDERYRGLRDGRRGHASERSCGCELNPVPSIAELRHARGFAGVKPFDPRHDVRFGMSASDSSASGIQRTQISPFSDIDFITSSSLVRTGGDLLEKPHTTPAIMHHWAEAASPTIRTVRG